MVFFLAWNKVFDDDGYQKIYSTWYYSCWLSKKNASEIFKRSCLSVIKYSSFFPSLTHFFFHRTVYFTYLTSTTVCLMHVSHHHFVLCSLFRKNERRRKNPFIIQYVAIPMNNIRSAKAWFVDWWKSSNVGDIDVSRLDQG